MVISGAVNGLASGLDTASIIEQMMAVERNPQTLLTQRRTKIQATIDAYSSIRSRLTALDTAANAVRRPADWQVRTATADSTDITVSASSGAQVGSLSFQVSSLAARHSVRSGNTISATTAVIASGGSIDITDGSGTQTLSVGSGTLAEVVSAINNSDLGLSAAAVNTGSGFRLQVTARSSGAANTFSIGSGLDAGVGGMVVAATGADASLTIGTGPGAYTVTSASNTFSDLIPGLTVTAKAVSTTPVTVTVADDVEALVTKVQALVDAVNEVRNEVNTRTAYNAEKQQAASLVGDPTARRLTQDLVRSVTDAVAGNSLGSAGIAGVSVDRFGKVTFDTTKFRTAYETNPSAVQSLFSQTVSSTGDVTFLTAGDRTTAGTHQVVITGSPTAATATGLTGGWPLGAATTVSAKVGDTTATYEIQPTDTDADAVAGLQAQIDGAGLNLTVDLDGGGIRITSDSAGSASGFEVAWDGTTFDPHAGTDVSGTIGGVAATGRGSILSVPLESGTVGGLSVTIANGATGNVGSVSYQPGIAQRIASAVDRAIDGVDGYLTSREEGQERRVADLDDSIAAWDIRLATRETRLRLQFSQLEVMLGELQSKSNWLSGQLSGLSANNGGS